MKHYSILETFLKLSNLTNVLLLMDFHSAKSRMIPLYWVLFDPAGKIPSKLAQEANGMSVDSFIIHLPNKYVYKIT